MLQQSSRLFESADKAAKEGRWDDAKQDLLKVVILTKPFPKTESALRRAYLTLAHNEWQQQHPQEAQNALNAAVDIVTEKSGADSLALAVTLETNAALEQQMKDDRRAEQDLRRAIAIREKKNEPADDQLPVAIFHLARLCHKDGRSGESINLLRTLLAKYDVAGRHDQDVTYPLMLLGEIYSDTGQYKEAEQTYLRALKLMESNFPAKDFNLSLPLRQLAQLYSKTGQEQEALRYRERLNSLDPPRN